MSACCFRRLQPEGVWTLRRDRRTYSVQVAGAFETDEMDVVRALIDFLAERFGPVPAWEVGW